MEIRMVQICSDILLEHQVNSHRIILFVFKLSSNVFLGSGKSSALTPHMDALGRTLAQMDINQEYIQYPNEKNGLSSEQAFIIANVKYDLNVHACL